MAKKHNIKKENLVFHRDYAPKSCPGSNMDIVFVRSLIVGQYEAKEGGNSKKEELISLLNKAVEIIKGL